MSNGKFASSRVVVGQTPQTKSDQRFNQLKGNKVTMGSNAPGSGEGAVGDITIRTLGNKGYRAYVKTNSGWIDLNSMVARESIEWKDMVLANNWELHSASYILPQYGKDANGFVHFRGTMKGGSGTTVDENITTLPPGFRPPKTIVCVLPNNGTWDGGQGSLQVTSNGVVSMPNGGDIDRQDLDGVSFFAWQSAGGGSKTSGPNPESGGHAPG